MANNTITLRAQDHTESGRGSACQARYVSQVPAVVHGHDTKPHHLLLKEHTTRLALRSNDNTPVGLDITSGETLLALAKGVQRHPIRPGVQHAGLLLVDHNKRVNVGIPVTVIDKATPDIIRTIKAAAAVVSAPITSVFETVEVNVTGVAVGTVLTLTDIALPEDVEAVIDAETAVVNMINEHVATSEVTENTPTETATEAETE